MTEFALARLRTISVIELLYLPLLLIPSTSALAVVLVLNPIALVIAGAVYVAGMLVGGSLVSAIFALVRRPGKPLTLEWRKRIDTAITTSGMVNRHDIAKRLGRARLSDLTVGAFVHASLRAQIVASGGLLVQILRGTPSAQAVIAHEYAHIRHLDRLYFMILLMYVGNLIVSPLTFIPMALNSREPSDAVEVILWWIFNVIVTTMITSKISVRRELAADFAAALIVGRQVYLDMLDRATGRHSKHGAGFFHPSIENRKAALIEMRVCRHSGWLVAAYCFLLASYIAQSMISNSRSGSDMLLAQAVYCAVGIGLEYWRWDLPKKLPDRPRDVIK